MLRSRLPSFLRRYWARIDASPLGSRLARGAFWSLVGAVISRGLGLVASILVARMLRKRRSVIVPRNRRAGSLVYWFAGSLVN